MSKVNSRTLLHASQLGTFKKTKNHTQLKKKKYGPFRWGRYWLVYRWIMFRMDTLKNCVHYN